MLKNILSTVFTGKDLAYIDPFLESKFSFKLDVSVSRTIVHFPFVQIALEFCVVDGTSIISSTLGLSGSFLKPRYFVMRHTFHAFCSVLLQWDECVVNLSCMIILR